MNPQSAQFFLISCFAHFYLQLNHAKGKMQIYLSYPIESYLIRLVALVSMHPSTHIVVCVHGQGEGHYGGGECEG